MDSEQGVATSQWAICEADARSRDSERRPSGRSKRNPGIDCLRVLCVLYIVGFWHVAGYVSSSSLHVNVISRRVTCIILGTFVFVSGYFIGRKGVDANWRGVLTFYKRRLLRIYPLYLIAIVAFAVLGLYEAAVAVKAALCLSMIAGPPPQTLWFITLLMMLYLAAPWIVIVLTRMSLARLCLYYILALVVIVTYEGLTGMADVRIVMYSPSFVLGIVCARGMVPVWFRRVSVGCVFVLLSVLLSFVPISYDAVLWAPMIAVCSYVVFMVWRDRRVSSGRVFRVVALLSYSSYAMYLFHRPIYEILMRFHAPGHAALRLSYLVFLGLPLVVATSFAIQKLYDAVLGRGETRPVHR